MNDQLLMINERSVHLCAVWDEKWWLLLLGSAHPFQKCEGNYDAHCTVGVVIGLRIFQRLGLRI